MTMVWFLDSYIEVDFMFFTVLQSLIDEGVKDIHEDRKEYRIYTMNCYLEFVIYDPIKCAGLRRDIVFGGNEHIRAYHTWSCNPKEETRSISTIFKESENSNKNKED